MSSTKIEENRYIIPSHTPEHISHMHICNHDTICPKNTAMLHFFAAMLYAHYICQQKTEVSVH